MSIDYDKLRSDLISYYGNSDFFRPIPIDKIKYVDNASEEELLEISKGKLQIEKYKKKVKTQR